MAVTYEQLREWVLALPGTREVFVEEWGHPTLRYGDKMFASGQSGSPYASVKASPEEQAELLAAAPEVYEKAAYVGRYGWVRVNLAVADPDELRGLVLEAWRRTAPKRVVREYESGQG
jgi:hypothetical protein